MRYFLFLFCWVFFSGFSLAQITANWSESLQFANNHVESHPDTSFFIAKTAYLHATGKGDAYLQAQSGLILGKILFYQGTFNQACEYLITSSKIFSALQKHKELADAYNWMGLVYQYSRQYPLAYNYYREALAINSELEHTAGIAETFGRIGHYFEKLGNTDTAIYYQHKALYTYKQDGKEDEGVAIIYDNLGSLYEDLAVFDSAYFYFRKSYRENVASGNLSNQTVNLNNIGDVYRKTGDFDKALVFADSALTLAKQHELKYQIRSAYKDLSKIHALKKDFKLAYNYLDSAMILYTKIFSIENAQRITQLQSLYESQRKGEQIAMLEEEKISSKNLSVALFMALAILFVVAGIVFLYQRSLLQRKRLIIRQQEKLISKEQEMLPAELKNSLLNEQNLKEALLNYELIEKQLREELSSKSQTLAACTLAIIRKNNFLEELKENLKNIRRLEKPDTQKAISHLIASIHSYSEQEEDWNEFLQVFEEMHIDFFRNLKMEFPELSSSELRLCALLKLNLSSKDAATILGISQDSLRVARYRLRKKLQLSKGSNLFSYLMVQ